jgi:hypothetical protein
MLRIEIQIIPTDIVHRSQYYSHAGIPDTPSEMFAYDDVHADSGCI